MVEIFPCARLTYLWLGESDEDSALGLQSVELLRSVGWQQLSGMPSARQRLLAIEGSLRRPYWRRVWVVQEAFRSRLAIVKCGVDETNFNAFYAVPKFLKETRAMMGIDPKEEWYWPGNFHLAPLLDLALEHEKDEEKAQRTLVPTDLLTLVLCTSERSCLCVARSRNPS